MVRSVESTFSRDLWQLTGEDVLEIEKLEGGDENPLNCSALALSNCPASVPRKRKKKNETKLNAGNADSAPRAWPS